MGEAKTRKDGVRVVNATRVRQAEAEAAKWKNIANHLAGLLEGKVLVPTERYEQINEAVWASADQMTDAHLKASEVLAAGPLTPTNPLNEYVVLLKQDAALYAGYLLGAAMLFRERRDDDRADFFEKISKALHDPTTEGGDDASAE